MLVRRHGGDRWGRLESAGSSRRRAPRWGTALPARGSEPRLPRAPLLRPGGRAWAAARGAASSRSSEGRIPERLAANSHNSEAMGELLNRLLCLAPTLPALSAAPAAAGKLKGLRSGSPLGGSSRNQGAGGQAPRCCSSESRAGGRTRPGSDGGARTRGSVGASAPRPRRWGVSLPEVPAVNCPSCFCLKLSSPYHTLPSDSAAPKANGDGASFKVHINLMLVGYSLAATNAVRKGI